MHGTHLPAIEVLSYVLCKYVRRKPPGTFLNTYKNEGTPQHRGAGFPSDKIGHWVVCRGWWLRAEVEHCLTRLHLILEQVVYDLRRTHHASVEKTHLGATVDAEMRVVLW
jgi:hypothetical protein